MGEGFQSLIAAAPAAAIAVAFLAGFGCAWLIWGLRGAPAGEADATAPAPAAVAEGDERKEIVVLRAEIEAARALLDQNDPHQEEIAAQLQAVDEALKRANGRLKIIQRGLKR